MTNDRLTLAQVVLLGTYAVGMAAPDRCLQIGCATLCSKRCSRETTDKFVGKHLLFSSLLRSICALAICWVWILTFTPLSRAYPFVALAFATAMPSPGRKLIDSSNSGPPSVGVMGTLEAAARGDPRPRRGCPATDASTIGRCARKS
jgi:hypothetical protein